MSAPTRDLDIIDIDEEERTIRGVDEAVITGLFPGSRKRLEKEILKYRHARDMRLLNEKWKKRGNKKR
jgi:hypothetical protein